MSGDKLSALLGARSFPRGEEGARLWKGPIIGSFEWVSLSEVRVVESNLAFLMNIKRLLVLTSCVHV